MSDFLTALWSLRGPILFLVACFIIAALLDNLTEDV